MKDLIIIINFFDSQGEHEEAPKCHARARVKPATCEWAELLRTQDQTEIPLVGKWFDYFLLLDLVGDPSPI